MFKENWVPKNWCFWTVVLEKTLGSPLDCKEIQSVHPKGDQSWVFIGRTDVEAETPILGHLMRRADSLEKTLQGPCGRSPKRRGSLRCLPPLEVRLSSVAPDPAKSRGAPPPPSWGLLSFPRSPEPPWLWAGSTVRQGWMFTPILPWYVTLAKLLNLCECEDCMGEW